MGHTYRRRSRGSTTRTNPDCVQLSLSIRHILPLRLNEFTHEAMLTAVNGFGNGESS